MSSSMLWDVDVESIYRIINDHEESISTLDNDIEELMRKIRQLQYQKQIHAAEIRRCKGVITLAKRLPPEILANIFEECINNGWTRTPLVVSHVCSSWRQAANIPTVWSHVYVNLDAPEAYKRTSFWLEKAQDSLLTIDLEVGNDTSHLDRVIYLLVQTLSQWKSLIIKSAKLHPVNQILQACNRPAPELRMVDISVAQEFPGGIDALDTDENELVGFRTAFLVADHFNYLRLCRNILPHRNIIPPSIKHLSLQLPSYQSVTTQSLSSIIHLLEELPGLEYFSLEVPNGQKQQFELNVAADRVVNLPRLSSMTLMGKENLFALLPHLRVPSLSELRLRSSLDYFQQSDIAVWIDLFLRHSSAPITLLEIRDLGLEPQAYDQILHSTLSVRELILHDCDLLDTTVQSVNGPNGLCPNLRKIDLRWCGRVSGRALVNLVRSRLPANSSASAAIEEITLINCSFVKEEDIMDLALMSVVRLIHHGQGDFCSTYGCCDNERYRKRLKQRNVHPMMVAHGNRRLIL